MRYKFKDWLSIWNDRTNWISFLSTFSKRLTRRCLGNSFSLPILYGRNTFSFNKWAILFRKQLSLLKTAQGSIWTKSMKNSCTWTTSMLKPWTRARFPRAKRNNGCPNSKNSSPFMQQPFRWSLAGSSKTLTTAAPKTTSSDNLAAWAYPFPTETSTTTKISTKARTSTKTTTARGTRGSSTEDDKIIFRKGFTFLLVWNVESLA